MWVYEEEYKMRNNQNKNNGVGLGPFVKGRNVHVLMNQSQTVGHILYGKGS